jgi:hypothetical protein
MCSWGDDHEWWSESEHRVLIEDTAPQLSLRKWEKHENFSLGTEPMTSRTRCRNTNNSIPKLGEFAFENCSDEELALSNVYLYMYLYNLWRARGSVVGWGIMLQAERSRVRFQMRSSDFFNWPNPSSRTMTLGSTQPLTEMSFGNHPGGKGRPARGPDSLTTICEPVV